MTFSRTRGARPVCPNDIVTHLVAQIATMMEAKAPHPQGALGAPHCNRLHDGLASHDRDGGRVTGTCDVPSAFMTNSAPAARKAI